MSLRSSFWLRRHFWAAARASFWGLCGPFTDVSDAVFCPFVLEIFTLGITTGTTPTTYDPTSSVNRLQMAAFLSRTVDGVLRRGGRRAALDQFWTTQNATVLGLTTVGNAPQLLASDGADIWVANNGDASVSRVRASDGKLLETWTGATAAEGVLVAMGRILVTGLGNPGKLYSIDPSQPAGAVTTVASNLGIDPFGIAFDGTRVWTANNGGSFSIVTPGATFPWTVTTVTTGPSALFGAIYDGVNVWVTNNSAGTILRLAPFGTVILTVTVGGQPFFPAFDGKYIWVPNATSNSVSVVQALTGAVLQTLTGNGLLVPAGAAFDGQRVLVTNATGNSVSLWKAADLTPLGNFTMGAGTFPLAACSDGVNFWITLQSKRKVARF